MEGGIIMNSMKSYKKNSLYVIPLILVLTFLTSCSGLFKARCDNTARLGKDDGVEVRVIGIDPDPPSTWANEASHLTWDLINGYTFILEIAGEEYPNKDEYGRLLRYVRTPENKDLGAELIKAGLVSVDETYSHPRLEEYRKYQEEAKKNKVGIWTGL